MTTAAANAVPTFRFRLNQAWGGNVRGDIIEVGPGLLDALQRGNRGELVKAETADAAQPESKVLHAKPRNKSLSAGG